MRALDGFRGLAAIHVVVDHFSGLGFGSIKMSLFYLLSGYTLALGYGRSELAENGSWINTLTFNQKRFDHIASSFYLSNAVAYCLSYK
jgi:peptidoglycan/LPS O-acetylase OafA/YrhL